MKKYLVPTSNTVPSRYVVNRELRLTGVWRISEKRRKANAELSRFVYLESQMMFSGMFSGHPFSPAYSVLKKPFVRHTTIHYRSFTQ